MEQHFKDIEHDPAVQDVTYENSQARERTQILMDLANQAGGLSSARATCRSWRSAGLPITATT
ncbi:MAG: hypothetical protein ACLTXI_09235 [Collinsella sp.]